MTAANPPEATPPPPPPAPPKPPVEVKRYRVPVVWYIGAALALAGFALMIVGARRVKL